MHIKLKAEPAPFDVRACRSGGASVFQSPNIRACPGVADAAKMAIISAIVRNILSPRCCRSSRGATLSPARQRLPVIAMLCLFCQELAAVPIQGRRWAGVGGSVSLGFGGGLIAPVRGEA
jgi:hypothetical protein